MSDRRVLTTHGANGDGVSDSAPHRDEPLARDDAAVARFAILRRDGGDHVGVASLQKNGEVRLGWSPDRSDEAAALADSAREAFRPANARDPQATWAAFRTLVVEAGYTAVDLPEADFTTTIQIDAHTGRMIAETRALHAFHDASSTLPADIFERIRTNLPAEAAGRAVTAIEAALAMNDHVAAAEAITGQSESLLLRDARDVLTAARRIEIDRLSPALGRAVALQRVVFAGKESDYGPGTADDIAWLRRHEPADDAERRAEAGMLALVEGCVAARAGRCEQALVIWRGVTRDEAPAAASIRGWAWWNISCSLAPKDSETERAARLSSDAFLQAGERVEAARSTLRQAECVLVGDPVRALALIDDALSWFDQGSLQGRDVRGNLLHSRAVAQLKLGRHDDAAASALSAATLRADIHGLEGPRASSLLTAAIALRALGRTDEAAAREAEGDALVAASKDGSLQLDRLIATVAQTFDMARAEALRVEARRLGATRSEAMLMLLIGSHADVPDAKRLEMLESAMQLVQTSRGGSGRHEDLNIARAAIACELQRQGSDSRALPLWEAILAADPLDPEARRRVGALLFKLSRWKEAAEFFHGERARFGETPQCLAREGWALLEGGDPSGAVRPLSRAFDLCPAQAPMRSRIQELLQTALARCNGQVPIAPPPAARQLLGRAELEGALTEFASVIAGEKRSVLWRKAPERRGRAWVSAPERVAQNLLHMFLRAKLADRAIILEEIAAGAGRLDLIVLCEGGFRTILELKMLGEGYPLSYALQGEEQILHYMTNRGVHMGFLVVFDARAEPGGGIEPTISVPPSTVRTVIVDVRPTWKRTRSPARQRIRRAK